jgi:hypothetical protein
MRHLTTLVLGLLVLGCSRSNDTTARYHEDGRAKPVVAVAPLLDTSSFDVPWSLSEEFTTMLTRQISQTNQVFVQSREDFSLAENPFGNDLAWMKQEFEAHEFAVFLELVEHELVSVSKEKTPAFPQEVPQNLKMGVRLRVVDLRGTTPKIVLQEMIRDSYYIPKTLLPTDYNVITWGSEEYLKSSMGMAHARLSQEIGNRVSEYILLAKSR